MNIKLEQQLMDNFPFMESRNLNGKSTGFPIQCECSDEWFSIIWDLCEELAELYKENNVPSDEIFVFQGKEKYGGLRFYTNQPIEEGYEIIDKYESMKI